jgi:hypothetical protein
MLAVLFLDQLGSSRGLQWVDLQQIFPQVKDPGRNFLFEINGMLFKFVNFDEHPGTPRAADSNREDRGSTV